MSVLRADGQTQQSWLWSPPAKHSSKQIDEVFERIELLYTLDVHKHLANLSTPIVRRYARRLAARPPSAGARIKEPARTVEVACFLRYCLFTTTDQAILMVQRRVADLWRTVDAGITQTVDWANLYKTLLAELTELVSRKEAMLHAEWMARMVDPGQRQPARQTAQPGVRGARAHDRRDSPGTLIVGRHHQTPVAGQQ